MLMSACKAQHSEHYSVFCQTIVFALQEVSDKAFFDGCIYAPLCEGDVSSIAQYCGDFDGKVTVKSNAGLSDKWLEEVSSNGDAALLMLADAVSDNLIKIELAIYFSPTGIEYFELEFEYVDGNWEMKDAVATGAA